MSIEKNSCGVCRFFVMNTAEKLAKPTGICRRYPPTVAVIGVPQRNMAGDISMGVSPVVVRPTVEASDFCGEFAVDLLVRS